MPPVLSNSTLTISLIETEFDKYHAILSDPNASEKSIDEAALMSVLYGITSGKLKDLYENLHQPGSNFPPYDELGKRRPK